MSKKAFTLAETLITIAIIGVVAALTLPTLISKYQKTVLVNQLKASYSVLSQGFKRMYVEEGVDKITDLLPFGGGRADLAREYANLTQDLVSKYFKIAREYRYDEYGEYTYSGIGEYGSKQKYSRSFVLANGAIVYIYQSTLYVDVNGLKGPNQIARDFFQFSLKADGTLQPVNLGGQRNWIGREADGFGGYINLFEEEYGAKRIIDDGWKMNY